ncbi:MAG TPA: hypothetical protein VN737_18455 [Bryobacteraceae bacterium]|nr:hypothetical protein [Bryobacteraceae bacterium]
MSNARVFSLLSAVLLPPIICLTQMEVAFALVPYACKDGIEFSLYIVHLVGLLLTLACGLMAYSGWKSMQADYSRFLAEGGMLSSGLFSLLIIAQGIATLLMGACQ